MAVTKKNIVLYERFCMTNVNTEIPALRHSIFPGRNMSTEKSNYLIGNQTRDLPACSIVPQPTTLLSSEIQKFRLICNGYVFRT
jgi:hypothetical protein